MGPLPPHVDEAAAASSIGRSAALRGGVHLLSITIRLSHSILSEDTSSIARLCGAGTIFSAASIARAWQGAPRWRVRVGGAPPQPPPERGIHVTSIRSLQPETAKPCELLTAR